MYPLNCAKTVSFQAVNPCVDRAVVRVAVVVYGLLLLGLLGRGGFVRAVGFGVFADYKDLL